MGHGRAFETRSRRLLGLGLTAASLLAAAPATAAEKAPAPGDGLLIDRGVLAESADDGHGGNGRFVLEDALKWRGSKTITYHSTAKPYREQVKQAASAWNKSGAKVRWKATSRKRAKVLIKVTRNLGSAGLATTTGTNALIEIQPGLSTGFGPKPVGTAIARAVIAHEMGHVMGLGHEPRECATMNAILWSQCRPPEEVWRYQCRALEPDDVKGGAKAFGGRPAGLASRDCALGAAPAAVRDFTAAYDSGAGAVKLRWSLPETKPPKNLTIYRGKKDAGCPGKNGENSSYALDARPKAGQQDDFTTGVGEFCYLAVGLNEYGRPGNTAEASVVLSGKPPDADFDWAQTEGTTVEFYDYSYDSDGDIVSWEWDFGDGSPGSSLAEPTHAFAAAGLYDVTLTVVDDDGNSADITHEVQVTNGAAPEAFFDWWQIEGTTVEFYDWSYDFDGSIVAWEWDFGDGSPGSSQQSPTHVFPGVGDYEVELTVTDDGNNIATYGTTVTVEALE